MYKKRSDIGIFVDMMFGILLAKGADNSDTTDWSYVYFGNYPQVEVKGTSVSKISAKKKAFTIKWKKQVKKADGYQIQYATNKKFKGAKSVTIKSSKTSSATIKRLKAKKKYFVRIRTFKNEKVKGKKKKVYSNWSAVKIVKTK